MKQPRINEPLRGRISHLSLDALANIAAHPGQRGPLALEATLGASKPLFWLVFKCILFL